MTTRNRRSRSSATVALRLEASDEEGFWGTEQYVQGYLLDGSHNACSNSLFTSQERTSTHLPNTIAPPRVP